MAKTLTPYEKLHKKYIDKTSTLFDDKDGKDVLKLLSKGKTSILRFDRSESSDLDMSWIKRIEDCIPELGEIVENPKRTIYTVSEVVQIEKAKKTSRESVQHLGSHTQFIKNVDENGEVEPAKILNIYNDDYYAIYENKFIATLIRRLIIFVEKRYDYILNYSSLEDVELLYMKNVTNVDGMDIEIETKVKCSRPSLTSGAEKLKGFIKRIEEIRKYLRFYMNTEFMRILRTERDVRNPILQTNIIRKNPLYHKCYLLWMFIERYAQSGIEVKVEENYKDLTKKEIDELNRTLAINFINLKGHEPSSDALKNLKEFKPEILTTLDDETFKPDVKFKGPIQFVRIDDSYREAEATLLTLNPHPTNKLKEYDKEKYALNKEKREKTQAIEALKSRAETRRKKYEEKEAQYALEEEQKAKMIDDMAEAEIHNESLSRLKKARKRLADKAVKDRR